MDEDTSKPGKSLIGSLGPYAELYPSVGARLQEVEQSANPEIRRRMTGLRRAIEAKVTQQRERLMQTWGLTQTEARLAIHLAAGGSVQGYADLFEVSVGTVRSQLKSIFAKTGVNRQAALAVLVGGR
jgi:DNA-binding CsgD family transcriptional regulator